MIRNRIDKTGFTLMELMVVILLIPLVGYTLVNLDMLVQNFFNRTTRVTSAEDEVEITLGSVARDIFTAIDITIYTDGVACSAPAAFGIAGNCIELTIDDDGDNVPPVPDFSNDDMIRYYRNGTDIIRQYAIDGSGGNPYDGGRTIASNVSFFEVTETLGEALQPQNAIRVEARSAAGGINFNRVRFVTSRALRANP